MSVNKRKAAMVTASTTLATPAAVFNVLTNPFREDRTSFKRRLNKTRSNLEAEVLERQVDACESCANDITIAARHKGEQFFSYVTGETRVAPYTTHCEKHMPLVKAYQQHKVRSQKD